MPSKDARERLLEAAIGIFAIHGFESASTRMIVKEANVNISAIPYYFGGKEGLYEAVMRHIVAIALEKHGKRASEIREVLDVGSVSQSRARDLLHEFLGGFTDFLMSEQASPYIGQIIIREQMRPSPVFDILYEEMMRPLHETLTRLVACITNLAPASQEAILCTQTILAQIVIFKTHREMILRRLKIRSYSKEQKDGILALILKNTDAILIAHKR